MTLNIFRCLTFPSITDTHELVVPESIPMTSFPAAFALKILHIQIRIAAVRRFISVVCIIKTARDHCYLKDLAKLAHFEDRLAEHFDCKLALS